MGSEKEGGRGNIGRVTFLVALLLCNLGTFGRWAQRILFWEKAVLGVSGFLIPA
jgi:hypothetical protein